MNRKVVKIDGKDVPFCASAAIPRLYRIKFQRDIFKDINKLEASYKAGANGEKQLEIEDLEIFENVAYIMALHANPMIEPTIEGWLDNFEMFSIYEILSEILDLWGSNIFTDSKAKKNTVLPSAN